MQDGMNYKDYVYLIKWFHKLSEAKARGNEKRIASIKKRLAKYNLGFVDCEHGQDSQRP